MNNIESKGRRRFLKGAGVLMALPWLESVAAGVPHPSKINRMVLVVQAFGVYAKDFYPKDSGRNYKLNTGMKELEPIRNDFTFFKNVDLSIGGGHNGARAILRDMSPEDALIHADGGVSVDARAAEHFATATRFPMLKIGSHPEANSWTRSGSSVPSIKKPLDLFHLLFKEQSSAEKTKKKSVLTDSESILDTVNESAKGLSRKLSQGDRRRLSEYFSSVRDAERKLKERKRWLDVPKPKGDPKIEAGLQGITEQNKDVVKSYEAFIDLIPLILQTDSSRVITLNLHTSGGIKWELPGVSEVYHTLTHHGNLPERIKQLKLIDQFHMKQYCRLVQTLKKMKLLESTQTLWCSGLSDGARHSNKNLPLILAGGGYKHGQCIDAQKKQPLANLYVSMLQKLGVETEHFNFSTGTMKGLS